MAGNSDYSTALQRRPPDASNAFSVPWSSVESRRFERAKDQECLVIGENAILLSVIFATGTRHRQAFNFGYNTSVPRIPKVLHEHINSAFPVNVCLIGVVLPNGYAQVSPRGSTMVFDDDHLAWWERGKGSTNAALDDGARVTVFFRKPQLRESGVLPKGGIARFYGTATIHRSGPVYEEIWKRVIQPEKDRDPEKKGFGVLLRIERAEDLGGVPLDLP